MNIHVTISIGADDQGITDTADEIAQKMLDALGGDPSKDVVTVAMSASGKAGNFPQPAPIPEG